MYDEVVVGAVGGEEGARVLEVLAFRFALERLVHRPVVSIILPDSSFTPARRGIGGFPPAADGACRGFLRFPENRAAPFLNATLS